jgi:hypothetical protein
MTDYTSLLNIGKPNKYNGLPYSPANAGSNSNPLNSLVNGAAPPTLPFSPTNNNGSNFIPEIKIPPEEDKGFDSMKFFGNAANGLTGLGAMLQAYNGYKQVQLGRDAFDFSKSTYNQDSANQARMVNSELEDRQRSRIGSTGNNNANGTYESLGSYMDKNRVSAKSL